MKATEKVAPDFRRKAPTGKSGRGKWAERALDASSVENARQIARRLIRELGP